MQEWSTLVPLGQGIDKQTCHYVDFPPTMATLRRAPPLDTTLLSPSFSSSFSARYNMHHMLESPLPSPALPSIIPRHGKKPPKPPHVRRALRWIISMFKWISGIGFMFWLIGRNVWSVQMPAAPTDLSLNINYTLIEDGILLEHPLPFVITDKQNTLRWTVSLPRHLDYPLKPSEYADVCHHSDGLAGRLRLLNVRRGFQQTRGSPGYYHVDPSFMDIQEALEYGLLPAGNDHTTNVSHDNFGTKEPVEDGWKVKNAGGKGKICERSLTYVLETTDAGIGRTLMGLWLAYGLAKKEDRAFFIDDAHWSYGKYSDLLKPPAPPACLPPPSNHRLPCPHQVRHLLVSSGTSEWTFGDKFNNHFQALSKSHTRSQERIFALARTGCEALFHLADPDAASAATCLSRLEADVRSKVSLIVGMHVRRGDRHPWGFQYQDSYTPLELYTKAAESVISSHFQPSSDQLPIGKHTENDGKEGSRILLASDDPDVYGLQELSNTFRAQSHISLANKAALDAVTPTDVPHDSDEYFKKFVEGNVGWEGGFFPSVYWGLGNRSAGSVAARGLREEREDPPPSELSLKLRQLVARAYLLDLKILGQSDAVVCAVSSMGCRLLGVMMGWEKGMIKGKWKNVDGDYGWRAMEEERFR